MPPEYTGLYIGFAAFTGLLFGSFLNVCIYRIPRDLSVVTPRSFCTECGAQIAWYDNIPVLSFFMLRGRCRGCTKSIAVRYPVVEFLTALLFAVTAAEYGLTLSALKWCVFEAALIVLFWTDVEERILPDEFTLGGTFLGLIFALFLPLPSFMADLLIPGASSQARSLLNCACGAVVLAIPVWTLGAIYARIRKREGLGFGDVKLLVFIGVFLGVERGLTALILGAVGGTLVGLTYILAARKSVANYELPFGAFLCAGGVISAITSKFL